MSRDIEARMMHQENGEISGRETKGGRRTRWKLRLGKARHYLRKVLLLVHQKSRFLGIWYALFFSLDVTDV